MIRRVAGIYIHIPFCKKLCPYCDFYHTTDMSLRQSFINSLLKETDLRKSYLQNDTIETIYLGGGTPSVLSPDEIKKITKAIRSSFSINNECEITIEINPDDVNPEFLKKIRSTGINRISLGIQSWRDKDLKILGRRHNSEKALRSLEEVIKCGFNNITIDLIYGIPGMTIEDWSSNLDKTFSYDIKHLSAYHITYEPGTLFTRMKEKGLIKEIEEEVSISQFNLLIEKSEKAGFVQYEISNFGKPGFFSIHNMNYWKQHKYLGLGPSAHSFNGYSRQWNIRDVRKYIDGINTNELHFEKEDLDVKTRFNEYIMTSLRTMWGIDLDYVERTFDKEGYDYIINMTGKFINYGLMAQSEKTLVLTNQGKMISDNIISELMLT